jgi:SNF2 family DNA or RNA helicase
VYDILLRELAEYNPVMYTGSESPTQKEAAKAAFLNGETDCFIISLRSGIGLDGLQARCNTVVIAELDWSPQVHNQVIGRVDRDGQKDQVTVIYLVSEFGSDPLIIDLLGLKASQAHGIINPLETKVADQYSDDTRIKLLAKKFLEKRGIKHQKETEVQLTISNT